MTGIKKYELDILDGSPPCPPFSMAGSKREGWNQEKMAYGMKQQNTMRGHEAAPASRKRPQRGRRTLAGNNTRGVQTAEQYQCHQRHGTIRAAARRIDIQGTFATRRNVDQSITEFRVVVSQIADKSDFDGAFGFSIRFLMIHAWHSRVEKRKKERWSPGQKL